MNFIIDENVSLGLVERLRSSGHKVISIAEEPNRGFEDEDIFTLCKKTKSILITRDYHFTNPIRFPAKCTKGIIYIRIIPYQYHITLLISICYSLKM